MARLNLSLVNGFPKEFQPNGKISTILFLEASNEVITLMEQFGKLFTPVRTCNLNRKMN